MWASQGAFRDREGRWWALTSQGLFRFRPEGPDRAPVFSAPDRVYTKRDGLPNLGTYRIFQDESGVLWLGAGIRSPRDGGLARLEAADGRIVALGPPDGLPLNSAPSAFVEDRDGSI